MNKEEIKQVILNQLNKPLTIETDGQKVKEEFAETMATVIIESGGEVEQTAVNSIVLYLNGKDIMHKERTLKDDEVLLLLSYRFNHKGTKGRGKPGKYKKNNTRWRIVCELKQSDNLTLPTTPDGLQKKSSYLKFNNYSRATKEAPDKYSFVKYAIAISKYNGGTAEHPGLKESFIVLEKREFKVAGMKNKLISVNIL